jgi:hypothetical protein
MKKRAREKKNYEQEEEIFLNNYTKKNENGF